MPHRIELGLVCAVLAVACVTPLHGGIARQSLNLGDSVKAQIAAAGDRVELIFDAVSGTLVDITLGGLATWFDYGDFTWDKFYHVILRSDAQLTGLIEDLGIAGKLNWSETKTGFLWNGRHLSMSSHWEFLTFPALSMINKIRLAAGILKAQRITDPSPLEETLNRLEQEAARLSYPAPPTDR